MALMLISGCQAAGAEQAPSLRDLLLSPGELSHVHQELRGECASCHSEFSKHKQSGLCVDCHQEIGRDLDSGVRFHGKLDDSECGSCHTEHLGPDARITLFDRDLFSHDQTAFPLLGLHQDAMCEDCHNDLQRANNKEDGVFRIEQQSCTACHEDPHPRQLDSACDSCHTLSSWSVPAFDHDRTEFPLTGEHSTALCAACHMDLGFSAKTGCVDCHASEDIHRSQMGPDCATCHSPTRWEETTFDHDQTDFPLRGKHTGESCQVCHNERWQPNTSRTLGQVQATQLPHIDVTPRSCSDCHTGIDIHQQSYGMQCDSCHSEDGWNHASFDHLAQTGFGLTGLHEPLPCVACHLPGKPIEKMDSSPGCTSCHSDDDVHWGALGTNCESCHAVKQQWDMPLFDHDFTNFPLTGLHRILPCNTCHESQAFTLSQTECDQCHAAATAHKDVFVADCESCHSTRTWRAWRFDHDARTSFPLDGAHSQTQCLACHVADLADPVHPPSACGDCHQADDKHKGAFGQQCDKCHTTSTFSDVQGIGTFNRTKARGGKQ